MLEPIWLQLNVSNENLAFFRTGALDEITYHANLDVWKNLKLRSRAFKNVANISTETTILGHRFSQPFFIAPAGLAGLGDPINGELNFVRSAAKAGILYVSSISSNKTTAEIGTAAQSNQTLFRQLYPWSNATRMATDLAEIKANGFKAVFLIVDNPNEEGVRTRARRADGPDSSSTHSLTFDLEALAALRKSTSLPIVPKGISNWQDAELAHSLGFPAIYVSNHGGRLIDGQQTAAEILLDIKKNAPQVLADKKMEIYADGGVRHGTDVLKLIALGAKAVGLGRSPMFANIWGEAGVDKLISIMTTELHTQMQLLGVKSLAEVDSSHINSRILENWL